MADIYIDSNAPVDSPLGTTSNPHNNIEDYVGSINDGDTVHLSGTFRPSKAIDVLFGTGYNLGFIAFVIKVGHELKTGDRIVVSGVTPSGYNGVYSVFTSAQEAILVGSILDPGAYSSGGTIKIEGGRGSFLTFSNLTDVTIKQWEGMPEYIVRGDTEIASFVSTSNHYITDLNDLSVANSAVDFVSIVEDWDTSFKTLNKSNGGTFSAHQGHMEKRDAATIDVPANTGSYYYDTVNKKINIIPSSGAASAHTYSWCKGGVAGWEFVSCNRVKVSGGKFYLFTDPDNGQGYGVKGSNCVNCSIEDCTAIDCGYHHFGFAGSNNDNCDIINCKASGTVSNGTNVGRASFVIFNDSPTIPLRGSIDNCEGYIHPLLNTAGKVVGEDGGLDDHRTDASMGLFHHIGVNPSASINGVIIKNCKIYGFNDQLTGLGTLFGASATHNTPVVAVPDEWDSSKYPVKIVDCEAHGVDAIDYREQSIAFIRCYFDPSADTYHLAGGSIVFGRSIGNGEHMKILMDSCVCISPANTSAGIIITRTNATTGLSDLRLLNCHIHTRDLVSPNSVNIVGDGTLGIIQNVFSVETGATSPSVVFQNSNNPSLLGATNDNLYDDAFVNGSNITGINSMALWLGKRDFDGIQQDVDSSLNSDFSPIFRSSLYSTKKVLSGDVTKKGINGNLYDGHYGPYQFRKTNIVDVGNLVTIPSM